MKPLITNGQAIPAGGREVESFLNLVQQQYAKALTDNDAQGMAETSGTLAISYAALSRSELARRWAAEYLEHYFALQPDPDCAIAAP